MQKADIEKKLNLAVKVANEVIAPNYNGYMCKIAIDNVQFKEWERGEEKRTYINMVIRYNLATGKKAWGRDYYRKFNCGYLKGGRYHRPSNYSFGLPANLAVTDKNGMIERIEKSAYYVIQDVVKAGEEYKELEKAKEVAGMAEADIIRRINEIED